MQKIQQLSIEQLIDIIRQLENNNESLKKEAVMWKTKYEQALEIMNQNIQDICGSPKKLSSLNSTIIEESPKKEQISPIRMFEVFFILEADITMRQHKVSWSYPANHNHNNLVKRLASFVFPSIARIESIFDDEFSSRKNQILYGTLGEELVFMLQYESGNNYCVKQLNPLQKLYAYVIVKPMVVNVQGQFYESDMAFCVITRYPFRQFFLDRVFRCIQQNLKLKYFENLKKKLDLIDNNYQQLVNILQPIWQYQPGRDFPFNYVWNNEITELKLDIESSAIIKKQQIIFASQLVKRIPNEILSRLMHFCMSETHLLLVSQNRRILNEYFEFLRIVLQPMVWTFPILYTLTDQLLPFLESPVPILAGVNLSYGELEELKWNTKQFIILDIDDMKITNDTKSHKYSTSVISLIKNLEKYATTKLPLLEKWVASKISFVKTGVINYELTEFEIDFMQTQMVEYLTKK